MKRIIIAIVVVFVSSCSSTKQCSKEKESRLDTSYMYLVNNYDKQLDVFSTSKEFDIVNFVSKISEDTGENEGELIESLEQKNIEDKSLDNISILKYLPKNINNNSDLKVFFSLQYEDYIIAEVFRKSIDKGNTYKELTTFGSSDVFLFKFKEDKVIKTYQIIMDYN